MEHLLNLGPMSLKRLKSIGLETAEDVRECDAILVYRRLKSTDKTVSLNLIYAILGFQQGVEWREIQRLQKPEILAKLAELD